MKLMNKFLLGVCFAAGAEAVMAKESYQFSIPAVYLHSSAENGAEATV